MSDGDLDDGPGQFTPILGILHDSYALAGRDLTLGIVIGAEHNGTVTYGVEAFGDGADATMPVDDLIGVLAGVLARLAERGGRPVTVIGGNIGNQG